MLRRCNVANQIRNKVSTIKLLFVGYYKIEKCPVCGHLFLGENDICKHCGYEPLYHGTSGTMFTEFKENYKCMNIKP